jgi:hypothetical protein
VEPGAVEDGRSSQLVDLPHHQVEPLIAVEVVALAPSGDYARLCCTRGSVREPTERVDERLVHTDHIVAASATRQRARPPVFVPMLHFMSRVGHRPLAVIRGEPWPAGTNYWSDVV